MKKKSALKSENQFLLPVFCIVISLLCILLDNFGVMNFLRKGLSFVFEPVAYVSNVGGQSVSRYFETFVKFSEFNSEFNQLKTELMEKEIENAKYALLLEENESLKEQVDLKRIENHYLMAKTLSDSDSDFIKINKGNVESVDVGDVVSVGDLFVGTIVEADERGSLVRLPTSRSSHLEVMVVRGNEDSKEGNVVSRDILSRGVVSGAPEGIKIENIPMNANVVDGDLVIISDEKIGEHLILGYLVNLSDNPATTSRFGFVSPIADYDDLLTVFVKID